MSDKYTTRHAARLYNVKSEQTIRNWIKEFAEFFSARVSPGKGTDLLLSREDMTVLDLIASMRAERRPVDEIHATLRSGQRGNNPDYTPEQLDALTGGDFENYLSTQLNTLKLELEDVTRERDELRTVVRPLQDDKIRLETEKEGLEKQLDDAKNQIHLAAERERKLLREIGKLEAMIDLLKSKNE
jgi:DNA-binding transcriptional MerR regulator